MNSLKILHFSPGRKGILHMCKKQCSSVLILALLGLMFASTAFARDFTFAWTAPPEAIDGYKLYYKVENGTPPFNGKGATEGDSPVNIGKVTGFTLHGLPDIGIYYFAITAYSGSEESAYSEIITHLPAPTGTTIQVK